MHPFSSRHPTALPHPSARCAVVGGHRHQSAASALRCALCLTSFLLELFDQHLHLVLPTLLVVVIIVDDDAIRTSGRHRCR